MPEYDYLIAGAGIAGLYTAYKLHKHFPSARICILEASNKIGGRLHTITYDGLSFDAGGARFNNQQKRILELVKELGLHRKQIPINSDIKYLPINPKYDSKLEELFPTIDDFILDVQKLIRQNKITQDTLLKTTLADFAFAHYGKTHPTIKNYITSIYPYYSELAILNALEGINLFTNEFSKKVEYYILAGGLQQLALEIYDRLKTSSNIDIHINTSLESITRNEDGRCVAPTSSDQRVVGIYTIMTPKGEYLTKQIILALPKTALSRIKYLTRNKPIARMINSIQPEPLYRIYARYPRDKETGKVWFADIPKIATNLPIKYIIPMNYEKGLIMISYTDAKYAKYWMQQLANDKFEEILNKQLKQVFPDKVIPKPKWYKHYYWNAGAGYWKPGYSRMDIMPQMIKPFGNEEEIFICGENYSSHQAWVEGALETADMVLSKLLSKLLGNSSGSRSSRSNKSVKRTKKLQSGGVKKYTMDEVAKHNKKSDAWIVIDGIVADITNWIPKHPGGNIIMKGVGKDASKLFHSIGHDEYAKKMLKKYQIGVISK